MGTNDANPPPTGARAQTPLWPRAAAVVVACVFLSWLTWLSVELRPPRIPRGSGAAEGMSAYQILDFAQEWASARNLLRGLPIYRDQVDALHDYLGMLPDPANPADRFIVKYNAHPPLSVLLGVPFAWMDYAEAFRAWYLASLALFAVSLCVVVRQLNVRITLLTLLAGWGLLLVCNPFWHQMNQGQLNMVLLALIVGGWALERSDWPVPAGAFFGLAAAIKLFPGFLLVYYAVRGRWRVVLGGAATMVVATGLSIPVLGLDAYRVYFLDVVPHVAAYRDWWVNASLSGLWSKLFLADSGHVLPLVRSPGLYWGGLAVSTIVGCAVLVRAARSARSGPEHDLTFGLAVIAMLLVGPITWDHALVLLLVPAAVLGIRLRRLGNWRWLFLASLAAIWLAPKFVFNHTIGGPGEYSGQVATPRQVLGVISYQCYGLIGLFTVAAVAVEREKRARRRNVALTFNRYTPAAAGTR